MTAQWTLPERFSFEGQAIAWGVIGEGPPAVVVHGSPFSSREWRRIAPWLARHRRVFYYDLLGYGQSAKPTRTSCTMPRTGYLQPLSITGASTDLTSSPMTSAVRLRCAHTSWMGLTTAASC